MQLHQHLDIVDTVVKDKIGGWGPRQTLDALVFAKELVLQVSVRSLCGESSPQLDTKAFVSDFAKVKSYIQAAEMSHNGRGPSNAEQASFRESVSAIRTCVSALLDSGNTHGHCLVSILKRNRPDCGGLLTEDQLLDELVAYILASFESTATALAWAMLLLAYSPREQEELRRQVRAAPADTTLRAGAFRTMPFLDCVVRETLRLYPPSWGILRSSTCSLELSGVLLPKGTWLMACPYTVQRREDVFDTPQAFLPSRWAAQRRAGSMSASYFPFGVGPRGCPGRRMAWLTLCAVLTRVIQNCLLELTHLPSPVADITLYPETGERIVVTSLEPATTRARSTIRGRT